MDFDERRIDLVKTSIKNVNSGQKIIILAKQLLNVRCLVMDKRLTAEILKPRM